MASPCAPPARVEPAHVEGLDLQRTLMDVSPDAE